MRLRRLLALGTAAVVVATGIVAASAPAHAVAAPSLASTIALNNCSGSLVRFPTSAITDRALLLTNGHCFEGGFLRAGQVLLNQASSRTGNLLDSTGATVGTVQADRLLYATMTGTDVALYRLTSTYASLRRKYGATALTVAKRRPKPGAAIAIPSSYWKEVWSCKVDTFVRTLREDVWTWRDSIRYDPGCDTIHGTSGSPVVDATTGQVVGINNTGNDNGAMCTLNNPCEVAPDGTTSAHLGRTYGQQTYWFTTCLTWRRTISLSIPGCLLTKPTT